MSGIIAIPCDERPRWAAFWTCVEQLERPAGWKVEVGHGNSPAANRNHLVNLALQRGVDQVFWLDDDLLFRPDTLMRLLRHDVEVVCGLSLHRRAPFPPLWFKTCDPLPVQWQMDLTPGPNGLVPIAGSTSGGLLTKTSVFLGLPGPYWTIGQIVPDEWHDDVWFCRLLTAGGLEQWGDPTVRFGHLTHVDVWPMCSEGTWSTVLAQGQQPFASLPMAQPV